jgi:hypothetical protein
VTSRRVHRIRKSLLPRLDVFLALQLDICKKMCPSAGNEQPGDKAALLQYFFVVAVEIDDVVDYFLWVV